MAKVIANVLVGVALIEVKCPVGAPAWIEFGYTSDGVNMEYNADTAEVEVEEETFSIDRVINKESLTVTLNMAESSLFNIDKAMAGSVLAGKVITLGGGLIKQMQLRLTGTNPQGYNRTIEIPLVTAMGAVGQAYRKAEKTVIPASFGALKPSGQDVCSITDSES